jgi:hypothetical protein
MKTLLARRRFMPINEIHFIREILVTDFQGKQVPTMQTSDANTSSLHPIFHEVAFYDVDKVRTLYHELGGGRHEGARMGSTVILPHRSRWAQLWHITADQVQVIDSAFPQEELGELRGLGREKARARNRLMRD